MVSMPIDLAWFEGAVSVAPDEQGGLTPMRLPWAERALFDPGLLGNAGCASGVRLRFATDAERVALAFAPMPESWATGHHFDATIDGELITSVPAPQGSESATLELPAGEKTVEIWLPQGTWVTLRGLAVNDGASCRTVPDDRPKWVTYGSSITHCVRAHSPARTWPALLARRHHLNLTSLGYGGQCHLETLMGLVIRDLPADFISLKLGINCIGGSLSPRTLPSQVVGLVRLIRERHPRTPIALISPIAYPPNETTPNMVGYTLQLMRDHIADAARRLIDAGDEHLLYVDGMTIFDETLLAQYSDDQCHPGPDGMFVQADRTDAAIMPYLLSGTVLAPGATGRVGTGTG